MQMLILEMPYPTEDEVLEQVEKLERTNLVVVQIDGNQTRGWRRRGSRGWRRIGVLSPDSAGGQENESEQKVQDKMALAHVSSVLPGEIEMRALGGSPVRAINAQDDCYSFT